MEAIQSRVESGRRNVSVVKWLYHNIGWFGAIGLAFYLGMGVNNNEANLTAVHQVQATYQGKVQYHLQHEKVLEKVAKTAAVEAEACEKNLRVALDKAASPQEVKGCPPVPPVVAPK